MPWKYKLIYLWENVQNNSFQIQVTDGKLIISKNIPFYGSKALLSNVYQKIAGCNAKLLNKDVPDDNYPLSFNNI